MSPSAFWIRVDRHPYWTAVFYGLLQVGFLVALATAKRDLAPELDGSVWSDPRVLAVCASLLLGSSLAICIPLLLTLKIWLARPIREFVKEHGLYYLPLFSGLCAALVVTLSALFYIVHGPVFAFVSMRGIGFVSSRVIDELLFRRGIVKEDRDRVDRREDAASIVVMICVWLGIVIPSHSDPSPAGSLFTDAWLFPAYALGYSLRLWCIKLYTVRWRSVPDPPLEAGVRNPFFLGVEQGTLVATLAVVAYLKLIGPAIFGGERSAPEFLERILLIRSHLPFALAGIPLGLSAIFGVSVLLSPSRTATHNFTLYRIAASVSVILGAGVVGLLPWSASSSSIPARDWLLLVGYLFALLLLHSARREELDAMQDAGEKPPAHRIKASAAELWNALGNLAGHGLRAPAKGAGSPDADRAAKEPPPPRGRDSLRFVRFVFLAMLLVFLAPGTHTVLTILTKSPYANNVNPIAVLGELLYSSASTALPVFAIFAFVIFVFQTQGAQRDAAALVDFGSAGTLDAIQLDEARYRRVDTAAKRTTLVVGLMTALVGLGVWMQSGVTGRVVVERSISTTFGAPEVRAGRRLFLQYSPSVGDHDPYHCLVCEGLRAYLRGDSVSVVRRSDLAPLNVKTVADTLPLAVSIVTLRRALRIPQPTLVPDTNLIATRTDRIAAVLNAVESVLEARRTGALSEIEFHSIWAGVIHEILGAIQLHLDGYPAMQDAITNYTPLLYLQVLTQQWPSDKYEHSEDPLLRLKRRANHDRPIESDDLIRLAYARRCRSLPPDSTSRAKR